MAIASMIQLDNCSYSFHITSFTPSTIISARSQFDKLKKRGSIRNDSFKDNIWVMTNENKTTRMTFEINATNYENYCERTLGCSSKEFITYAKTFFVLNFGASLNSLSKISAGNNKLIDYLCGSISAEELQGHSHTLTKFLAMFPNQSPSIDELIDTINDISEKSWFKTNPTSSQRNLVKYQSYLRFDNLLTKFWEGADEDEKKHYLPVFLWWNLTSILPLRPTEFVLTPRTCLQKEGDRYKLTFRRTKLKGNRNSCTYNLEKDYSQVSYYVPKNLALSINNYIESTNVEYQSDINTLFCTQYFDTKISQNKLNKHFTYSDLSNCLTDFYVNVLVIKSHIKVHNNDNELNHIELQDDEIEQINLGDTRHLAMINLIVSGGNPVICKELAGHSDINISSHYYANIKSFVQAISFERLKKQSVISPPVNQQKLRINTYQKLADGGYCSSPKAEYGDYSDCLSGIGADGQLLNCKYCSYYISPNKRTRINLSSLISNSDDLDVPLQNSFNFLLYSIEQVRKGLGHQSDIQSSLLILQAQANQYSNAIIQKYEMGDF